jgi:transcriptional regulator with XRE-family HTH domain
LILLVGEVPDLARVRRQDPDQLVRDVGARIGELRRAAGLTQEQFAEAMNASVQYASRVEFGENLTLYSLAKIADALDVRVVDLFQPATVDARPKRGRPRKPAT